MAKTKYLSLIEEYFEHHPGEASVRLNELASWISSSGRGSGIGKKSLYQQYMNLESAGKVVRLTPPGCKIAASEWRLPGSRVNHHHKRGPLLTLPASQENDNDEDSNSDDEEEEQEEERKAPVLKRDTMRFALFAPPQPKPSELPMPTLVPSPAVNMFVESAEQKLAMLQDGQDELVRRMHSISLGVLHLNGRLGMATSPADTLVLDINHPSFLRHYRDNAMWAQAIAAASEFRMRVVLYSLENGADALSEVLGAYEAQQILAGRGDRPNIQFMDFTPHLEQSGGAGRKQLIHFLLGQLSADACRNRLQGSTPYIWFYGDWNTVTEGGGVLPAFIQALGVSIVAHQ